MGNVVKLGCSMCGFSFMLNRTKRDLKDWYYCPDCGNNVYRDKAVTFKPKKPEHFPELEKHRWG